MRDLTSAASMKLKAVLFLVIGLMSGAILVMERPEWRTGLLLAVCVWAFCRAYYFAFYVIEKYVDPSFKFSGLGSAVRYLLGRKSGAPHQVTAVQKPEDVPAPRSHHLPLSWWLLWLFMITLASLIPWFHMREDVREIIEPLRYPWGLLPAHWLFLRWLGEISWYILAAHALAGFAAWKNPALGRSAILAALVLQMTFTTVHILYSTKLVTLSIIEESARRHAIDREGKSMPSAKETSESQR